MTCLVKESPPLDFRICSFCMLNGIELDCHCKKFILAAWTWSNILRGTKCQGCHHWTWSLYEGSGLGWGRGQWHPRWGCIDAWSLQHPAQCISLSPCSGAAQHQSWWEPPLACGVATQAMERGLGDDISLYQHHLKALKSTFPLSYMFTQHSFDPMQPDRCCCLFASGYNQSPMQC